MSFLSFVLYILRLHSCIPCCTYKVFIFMDFNLFDFIYSREKKHCIVYQKMGSISSKQHQVGVDHQDVPWQVEAQLLLLHSTLIKKVSKFTHKLRWKRGKDLGRVLKSVILEGLCKNRGVQGKLIRYALVLVFRVSLTDV